MTKKLLQKTSNKYLQLHPPENLLPAKGMGRKKKGYCGKKGMSLGQYLQMESRICNQWAFSWNALHRRIHPVLGGPLSENVESINSVPQNSDRAPQILHRISTLPDTLPLRGVDNAHSGPPDATRENPIHPLAPPATSRGSGGVSSAVGGGLIDVLNRALQVPSPECWHSVAGKAKEISTQLIGTSMQIASDPVTGGNINAVDREHKEKVLAPFCYPGSYRFFHQGKPLYHFPDVIDCVSRQINCNHWAQIYDPQEIHRAVRSRDRVTDDYRNQLAECRKISILYGNLSRKTLFRCMQLAKKSGGDVDSAFLSALERRLDVALKRVLFFPTIKSARQWISQGKVCVNNCRVTICSYQLQPGDQIALLSGERQNWGALCLRSLGVASSTGRNADAGDARVAPPVTLQRDAQIFAGNTQTRESGWGKPQETPTKTPAARNLSAPRFLFSPPLARKWKRWSSLWSNESHTPVGGGRAHNWESPTPPFGGKDAWGAQQRVGGTGNGVDTRSTFLGISALFHGFLDGNRCRIPLGGAPQGVQAPGVSRNVNAVDGKGGGSFPIDRSVRDAQRGRAGNLAAGYAAAGCALRRETEITKWFRHTPGGWSGRNPDRGKIPSTRQSPRYVPHHPRNNFPHGVDKHLFRQWLHHQERLVVDGLYHIRSMRGERKSLGEKKRDWRWSCMKPLHLECNYKQCTAIFLYPPQKLAWPSSINCSLLRKALA